MQISYHWLKNYIHCDINANELQDVLTSLGLEVESVETYQSVKGGLKNFVVGFVEDCQKHPDADKLSLTKVNVGKGNFLNIVCGAPNVAKGQKVIVALEGAEINLSDGNSFTIKKSKIRGAVSEGMICALDELNMGSDHSGILVLPVDTPIGMPASEYFNIFEDKVFTIGLTPNRVDAANHIGVARDVFAWCKLNSRKAEFNFPELPQIVPTDELNIEVTVENVSACPRYSSLTFTNVQVKESPSWLKNYLDAIGVRTINNVVDITNFVLHEMGQPLHAFDADAIEGKHVIVKTMHHETEFITLDSITRKLHENDLMICNSKNAMCIAGVFGGISSGITSKTTNIFLESAYFNPSFIRKTSKRHDLKTDAAFRYERGADPNITIKALQRAASLLIEVCGAKIASPIQDYYPNPIQPYLVNFSLNKLNKMAGQQIEKKAVEAILEGLDIQFNAIDLDTYQLKVPTAKVDVTREIDVIEEILRVYGYDNILTDNHIKLSTPQFPNIIFNDLKENIANRLTGLGFSETMSNSLNSLRQYEKLKSFEPEKAVFIANPLSVDLGVMRYDYTINILENLQYNINRKNSNLLFYEFGSTYRQSEQKNAEKVENAYVQEDVLVIYGTGKVFAPNWIKLNADIDFYYICSVAEQLLENLNLSVKTESVNLPDKVGIAYFVGKDCIAEIVEIPKNLSHQFDIQTGVFVAELKLKRALKYLKAKQLKYKEVPKFQAVERDLALLVNKEVDFSAIKQAAIEAERSKLKSVTLFDVYEGKNLPEGKKSYAVRFELLNLENTLTEKEIEKIMQRILQNLQEKLKAELR